MAAHKRLHIGLIGGIGVAATLSYYDRLARAAGDGAEITIVHAQIAELARSFGADDRAAPEGDLDAVGRAYQDLARRGSATAAERAFFLEEGRRLVARGADAVVLAGTDLNLAFDGAAAGYKVIDALDAHVAVLADLATGRGALSDVM